MSERIKRVPGWVWMGLGLFLLLMARACAAGPEYWFQLDDYIQLWNYPKNESFWNLNQTVGLLASRPLAGAADYFFWGRMVGFMMVGVALICAMYALSAVLLQRIVRRYFASSPIFLVVMALLPLGVEGTYWMSAATRVVVGMFCAALAGTAFAWWMDKEGWRRGTVYALLQLLPFGFYEQAAIFSVALVMGMAILEWAERRQDRRRGLLALWGIPAMGLYLLLTHLLSGSGVYGSRTALRSLLDSFYWTDFLPDVLRQLYSAFAKGGFYTLAKGFLRGMRMIFSGELLVWALALVLLCGLFLWLTLRFGGGEERGRHGPLPAFVCGLLLAAAPVSLFFVLETAWFSLRNTVSSFPGIALMADAVILGLWNFLPGRRRGPAALAAGMALVFCVAGASEVWDYRETYEHDQRTAHLILDTVSPEEGRVGILGLEPSGLSDQNFYWHEHIHGCTESSWALAGLMTAVSTGGVPSVTPLPSTPMYYLWNQSTNRPEGFDALYWYNPAGEGSLVPVTLSQTGEHAFDVLDPGGRVLGAIWEEADGLGYFRLSQP